MKWTNRQYVDLMSYGSCERPMFSELFGPIIGLDKEWRAQGASEDQIAMTDFAFDFVPYHRLGTLGAIHCPKEIVLEDTPDTYIAIDYLGRKVRMSKSTSTIPLPMTYPVETMDDWLKIKHMFAYDESRISDEEIDRAIELQKQGYVIVTEILGAFDTVRELMGEENGCIAYYDDPELVEDILSTISDSNKKVLNRIASRITIDQLSIHEDMAGKTAPMVGPNIIDTFFRDYYHDSWDIVRNSGTKLFCQDSDGNMNLVIDSFIQCGVNIFYPCEPAGDMDIVKLRQKYGHTIAFRGGIDKHVLRRTKEEIKAELDYKMSPEMCEGGIVFGLDHRIPNGTPFENYLYYIRYAREKLGLEPFETAEKGWGRMAF